MPANSRPEKSPTPLSDADLDTLHGLLDAVPAPCQPLDLSALDGYLCAVLLQPRRVPDAQWLAHVHDVDGRPLPAGHSPKALHALVSQRHAWLEAAIARRDWFDPWVFAPEDDATPPSEAVLPWVAGFATAMGLWPALADSPDPQLVEPFALLYQHLPREDLEDAEALLALMDELEPPQDLAEAVEQLVRSVMLMADVTRPRASAGAGPRRPGPAAKGPR